MELETDLLNDVEDDEDADIDEAELEENDQEEEYNLRMFGINQALPVEGEPDWESGGNACNCPSATSQGLSPTQQPCSLVVWDSRAAHGAALTGIASSLQ